MMMMTARCVTSCVRSDVVNRSRLDGRRGGRGRDSGGCTVMK